MFFVLEADIQKGLVFRCCLGFLKGALKILESGGPQSLGPPSEILNSTWGEGGGQRGHRYFFFNLFHLHTVGRAGRGAEPTGSKEQRHTCLTEASDSFSQEGQKPHTDVWPRKARQLEELRQIVGTGGQI